MKTGTLVFLVVILIVINLAALATIIYERATSQPEPPFPSIHEPTFPAHAPMALRELHLTRQQRQELRQSRKRLMEVTASLEQDLMEKRQQLFAAIEEAQPDIERINILIEEIGHIQTEIQKQVIHSLMTDHAFLDRQQRKLLLRHIEQRTSMKAKRELWHKRGIGRGRQP